MAKKIHIEPEIIEAAQYGDVRSFELILFECERSVYSFIFRMVQNTADAADLTQETFLKAYQYLSSYDTQKTFSTWLFAIGHHVVVDWLRKEKRQKTEPLIFQGNEEHLSGDPHPLLTSAHVERQLDLEQAITRIKPVYREVVLLYYWEGYTYQEISETLEIPLNTVRTYLRRGRKQIKSFL